MQPLQKLILTFLTLMATMFQATQTVVAALATSTAEFGPTTVVDFSQFHGPLNFTAGPVQVGGLVGEDIVWTSTSASSVIGSFGNYQLGSNGTWNANRIGFVGTNGATSMRFDFKDGAVSAVGVFMSYVGGRSGVTIEALGVGDTILETFAISTLAPIVAPNANDGAFRGFVRDTADIVALRILGTASPVVDDLTFSRPVPDSGVVPEPTSVLVWTGLGLACIGTYKLRRYRSH